MTSESEFELHSSLEMEIQGSSTQTTDVVHKNLPPVFEHYEVPDAARADINSKFKCRYCKVVISGRLSVTSNFLRHLRVSISKLTKLLTKKCQNCR